MDPQSQLWFPRQRPGPNFTPWYGEATTRVTTQCHFQNCWQIRTHDLAAQSLTLYRLSYPGQRASDVTFTNKVIDASNGWQTIQNTTRMKKTLLAPAIGLSQLQTSHMMINPSLDSCPLTSLCKLHFTYNDIHFYIIKWHNKVKHTRKLAFKTINQTKDMYGIVEPVCPWLMTQLSLLRNNGDPSLSAPVIYHLAAKCGKAGYLLS